MLMIVMTTPYSSPLRTFPPRVLRKGISGRASTAYRMAKTMPLTKCSDCPTKNEEAVP